MMFKSMGILIMTLIMWVYITDIIQLNRRRKGE